MFLFRFSVVPPSLSFPFLLQQFTETPDTPELVLEYLLELIEIGLEFPASTSTEPPNLDSTAR